MVCLLWLSDNAQYLRSAVYLRGCVPQLVFMYLHYRSAYVAQSGCSLSAQLHNLQGACA